MLELFTRADFQYYWKEERELITLSGGDLLASYFQTVSDPKHVFYFYLMAEIIVNFIPAKQKDKRLFRLLASTLEACSKGESIRFLTAYFLVWILRIEGLMFAPKSCSNCNDNISKQAWIRTDFRGILCQKCRTDEQIELKPSELEFIEWSRSHPVKSNPNWPTDFPSPGFLRSLVGKIQYHGELSLKCQQYLPDFR